MRGHPIFLESFFLVSERRRIEKKKRI